MRRPASSAGEGCSNVIPTPSIEMSMTRHLAANSPSIWQTPSQPAGWRGARRRNCMLNLLATEVSKHLRARWCHGTNASGLHVIHQTWSVASITTGNRPRAFGLAFDSASKVQRRCYANIDYKSGRLEVLEVRHASSVVVRGLCNRSASRLYLGSISALSCPDFGSAGAESPDCSRRAECPTVPADGPSRERPPERLWGGFDTRPALTVTCLAVSVHFLVEMAKLARTDPLHQLFQQLRSIRFGQRLDGLEHLLADLLIRGVGT